MKRPSPLSPSQVCRARTWLAGHCRQQGASIRQIAQVMRLTPEEARRYVAKFNRFKP